MKKSLAVSFDDLVLPESFILSSFELATWATWTVGKLTVRF